MVSAVPSTSEATRVAVAIAAVASSTTVWVAIAVAEWASSTIWAICMRSELLGELLLLSNSILHSLLLGSDVVLVLLLLSSDELLVLLLLSLHELLALGLGLDEGLLLGLTDLLDLLGGHAVRAVREGATVVWGSVGGERHFGGCDVPM